MEAARRWGLEKKRTFLRDKFLDKLRFKVKALRPVVQISNESLLHRPPAFSAVDGGFDILSDSEGRVADVLRCLEESLASASEDEGRRRGKVKQIRKKLDLLASALPTAGARTTRCQETLGLDRAVPALLSYYLDSSQHLRHKISTWQRSLSLLPSAR